MGEKGQLTFGGSLLSSSVASGHVHSSVRDGGGDGERDHESGDDGGEGDHFVELLGKKGVGSERKKGCCMEDERDGK